MDQEVGISQEAQSEEVHVETEIAGAETKSLSYHDRVRAEPDFAVDEIRKKDSYIGQLNQRMSKLKDVERYVDSLGSADALLDAASYGHQIKSNPQLQRLIDEAINGKSEPAKPDIELYDPEAKQVYELFSNKFEQQEQIIRDLRARLDRTEVASVKGSLRENIDNALSKFEGDPEITQEAQEQIVRAVEGLERAAASGNRSAASQLEQIASPDGARLLRMMTMDIYDRYVEKRLQSRAPSTDGAALKLKATDDRSTTRSALPSDEVSVKPGTKVTTQLVRQLMVEGARKRGKDPGSIWR